MSLFVIFIVYFLLSVERWECVSLRGSIHWGPCILGRQRTKVFWLIFCFRQTKLATWLTRCNRPHSAGLVELLFKGLDGGVCILYKTPLKKRSGDLQWRILQGALAVSNSVSKIKLCPLNVLSVSPQKQFPTVSCSVKDFGLKLLLFLVLVLTLSCVDYHITK